MLLFATLVIEGGEASYRLRRMNVDGLSKLVSAVLLHFFVDSKF